MSEPTLIPASHAPGADAKAVRILAKSVYRELVTNGHSRSDIVAFTNAMLELVTSDLREEDDPAA